jgi:GxxExxY protein
MVDNLIYKDEVFAIIGAAIEVHRVLGSGFLEPVYQEAFGIEMMSQFIPFVPQKPITILYKGQALHKEYIADYVCCEKSLPRSKRLIVLLEGRKPNS